MHPLLQYLTRCRGALCAFAWLLAVATGSSAQVLVVLSDETASYEEVAAEMRVQMRSVRDGRLRIDAVTADGVRGMDATLLGSYELVVTVGLAAAQAALDREHASVTPMLCLLIPRLAYERMTSGRASGRERRPSAVFIDQPLSRQLQLIRIALPQAHRVGVVFGPSSILVRDELRERARERDLVLKSAEVTDAAGVYGALQGLLPESDVLLAIPDAVAVNASTIYGLLLTSYRAQIPVVGFSEGLVKAGALLGLFSTSAQQGRQGAEIAARVLAGEAPPAPQYPKYFTVRGNYSVARSLGLRLPDEAALATALAARSEAAMVPPRPRTAVDAATPGKAP